MTRTYTIEVGQQPKAEQLLEVEKARESAIVFDDDCRELSPAMMKDFKSAVIQRNRRREA